VTKNLTLKLVSVIAATLLAFALQDASNASVVTLFVPIELRNPPADKMLVKKVKQGVQVTIKGPSFLIGEVAASPPPLRLKLPDEVEGKYVAQLMGSDISLPPSVSVLSLDPNEVELVFESIEEREVKVEVPHLGSLAKDLALVGIELDPKVVTVRGPRSELKQLRSVETQPLDLRDVKSSERVTLPLRKPGAMSSLSIDSVSAKVEVEPRPVERHFSERPLELRTQLDLKWIRWNPSQVTVTLSGEAELMSELRANEVVAFIQAAQLPARSGDSLDVGVDVPKGTKLVKVSPSSVTVWYEGPSKGSSKQPAPKRR